MKQEEFMESIYGCLERIENKISGCPCLNRRAVMPKRTKRSYRN